MASLMTIFYRIRVSPKGKSLVLIYDYAHYMKRTKKFMMVKIKIIVIEITYSWHPAKYFKNNSTGLPQELKSV